MQESRIDLEAFRAKLELDVANKLRSSEDRLDTKVRSVEVKLTQLQQVAGVLGGLALIFGVSGAWGYLSLNAARSELISLQSEVSAVSKQIAELNALKEGVSKSLKQAAEVELGRFDISAREVQRRLVTEATEELAKVRSAVSTRSLDVRTLRITDESGKPKLVLTSNEYGGSISAFSREEKRVATFGAERYGGGVDLFNAEGQSVASLEGFYGGDFRMTLRNGQGKTVVAAGVSGGDGVLTFFDRFSGSQLVSVTGSNSLGGYITLGNSQGSEIGKLPR